MFCGGGGSSRGVVMAGAIPVAALDMWDLAVKCYQLNFSQATVYHTRAEDLAPDKVLKEAGPIDLIVASPECTSHSVAKGKARRCEKSRETAFEVVRFAEILQPRWIVVENVAQMQRWRKFSKWLNLIKGLGYKTEIGVLNAQNFNVPQSRRRMFLLCDLERQPSLPEPHSEELTAVSHILGCGQLKRLPWQYSPGTKPCSCQGNNSACGASDCSGWAQTALYHGVLRNRRSRRIPNSRPAAAHNHDSRQICFGPTKRTRA